MSLVDRSGERRRVRDLLGRMPLVTLTGFPGVGKSALARDVAGSVARDFPDGVWVVPLAEVADPELVAYAIARTLGIPDRFDRTSVDVLGGWIRDRRCLLVLDDCEHLTEGCARVVDVLGSCCPGARVLATSRRPLGRAGEHVLKLSPLEERHAMALLRARAREAVPTRRIGLAEGEELCQRLDGLPLAIELAARQVARESVSQVVRKLDVMPLVFAANGGTGRHDSLMRAIGWSHQISTPTQRLLWARLSVFSEEFSSDDAEYVCSGPVLTPEAVRETLPGLAEASLLGEADGTYRMPRLVRAYGQNMLRLLNEDLQVEQRYGRWRRRR